MEEQIEEPSVSKQLAQFQASFQHLSQNINAQLLNLFWKIGSEINAADTPQIGQDALLEENYGAYMSASNLAEMSAFASTFRDAEIINELSLFLGWDDILALLHINSEEARQYYLRSKLEKGLDHEAFIALITSGRFRERPKKQARDSYRELAFWKKLNATIRISNQQSIPNFFEKSRLAPLRKLLQLSNQITLERKVAQETNSAHEQIVTRLENFRKQLNLRLNIEINLCLWTAGKALNEVAPPSGAAIRPQISKELNSMFDRKFTADQLDKLSCYASLCPDFGTAGQLATLLSWDHIAILLPLADLHAIFFYAYLTAQYKLSVTALKEQLANDVYATAPDARERQEQRLTALHNPTQTTTEKKSRRGNVTITTFDYSVSGEDILKPVWEPFSSTFLVADN